MSNSSLIKWFDQLLFGSSNPCSPPVEVSDLILRMESENISWHNIISQGGFTVFAYQVHGDLNVLLDFLEKQWLYGQPQLDSPQLKTRAVSKFWNELQLLLARRFEEELLPVPSKRDDEILKEILESPQINKRFDYESASFWGGVAKKFINLSRPESASPLPDASSETLKRAMQLYDVTCKARGQYFDPLSMYLVPRSEYLNAIHWQSSRNLEAFMHNQPTHPLTLCIQSLFKKCLNDILHCKKSLILYNPFPQLDALLHNIKVIHQSIEQVPHANTPPRLIDVFQRLLALCQKDGLWEKEISEIESDPVSTGLLYLTEKIRILEREKRILWKMAIETDSKSDSEPPAHICSNYLYAKNKKR